MFRPVPEACRNVYAGFMTVDRIRGSLVGLAVGDVMGCPCENAPRQAVEVLYGLAPGEPITELPSWPAHEAPVAERRRLRGLHSDDTQQALTIAQTLLDCGELSAEHLVGQWKALAAAHVPFWDPNHGLRVAKMGAHRGEGGTLRALVRGTIDDQPPSHGDGAAMRVAPIALFYRADRQRRIASAAESAWISHRHPHGVGAAVAVAAAVAAALVDGLGYGDVLERSAAEADVGVALFGDRYDAGCRPHQAEFGEAIRALLPLEHSSVEDGLAAVAANARRMQPAGSRSITATTSQAIAACVAALWLAARHLDDYGSGVLAAINAEGDTDTVAAMVGSIVGARVGMEAIPLAWRGDLIALPVVVGFADRLAAGGGAAHVDLLAWETRWTRIEALARQNGRIVRRLEDGKSAGKRCKP